MNIMATYLLVTMGLFAVASTVICLLGACTVMTTRWLQGKALFKRNDLAASRRAGVGNQWFLQARDDLDPQRPTLARPHRARPSR
jgi:hypothetical protein